MVDLDILKEKIDTISTLVKLTKGIGLILIILNVLGLIYNKIEFTIFLSLIVVIFLWLWTLDAQVGRIEKLLKEKRIIKEEGKNAKK